MFLSKTLWFLVLCCCSLHQQGFSQQSYVADPAAATCSSNGTIDSSNGGGYICNGASTTCPALLTFRAAAPNRNTVQSISRLLNTDSSAVSAINSITDQTAVLETDRLVLVPITCTCSGSISTGYYQLNVPYIVHPGDSASLIVNQVFEGLATCNSLLNQNPTKINAAGNVSTGVEIVIPIRCVCPTVTQTAAGIRYLMTYMVAEGDTVEDVSARFRVDPDLTFKANELSEQSMIYPSTALLVPVTQNQPSISGAPQTLAPQNWWSRLKTRVKILIVLAVAGVITGTGLTLWIVFKIKCCNRREVRQHTTAVTNNNITNYNVLIPQTSGGIHIHPPHQEPARRIQMNPQPQERPHQTHPQTQQRPRPMHPQPQQRPHRGIEMRPLPQERPRGRRRS